MSNLDEYSIWLETSSTIGSVFTRAITDAADHAGTVKFVPHITLLGGLKMPEHELLSRMELLPTTTFSVFMDDQLEVSDAFYKALYLKCLASKALIELRTFACKVFGVAATPYEPHLSLLYGDVLPIVKDNIKEGLKREHTFPLTVPIVTMSLWHAKGTADMWKCVHTIPLT